MRDKIGNAISEKSLLLWHPAPEMLKHGLVVQAVYVTDGGISLADSKETTPAMLIIQIPVYVNTPPRGEPRLDEFLCLVNPQAEAAIDKILEGQRAQ